MSTKAISVLKIEPSTLPPYGVNVKIGSAKTSALKLLKPGQDTFIMMDRIDSFSINRKSDDPDSELDLTLHQSPRRFVISANTESEMKKWITETQGRDVQSLLLQMIGFTVN